MGSDQVSDHPPLPPGFVLEDRQADIAHAVDSVRPQAQEEAEPGLSVEVPGLSVEVTDDSEAQHPAPPPGFQEEGAADPASQPPSTLSGLTEQQILDKFDKLPDFLRPSLGDAATHGILAGIDTEAAGVLPAIWSAIRHPVDAIQSGGGSVADAYHQGRTDALAALDYLRLKHPYLAPAAEIGGALLNPIGAEAKGLTGLAKVGAGYGAVSGFEDNNGDVGDRLGSGAKGAAIGAVAAPVIGAAIKTPGAIRNLASSNRDLSPIAEDFQASGIDPMAAYVGGDWAKRLTGGARSLTLGGIPIAEKAAQIAKQAKSARDRIVSAIGTVGDPESAGSVAQTGMRQWMSKTGDTASKLYNAVPIAADRQAVLTNTRQALGDLTQGFTSNEELSRLWADDPRLEETLKALTRDVTPIKKSNIAGGGGKGWSTIGHEFEGGQLAWGDLQHFRSIVGQIIGRPGIEGDGARLERLRALYGALSEDMRATARAEGPRAASAFERANSYWRARSDRIENVATAILGKENGATGQSAWNKINSWASSPGETTKLVRMMRSLPADEVSTVQASILSKLGNANPGAQSAAGDEFSPDAFVTAWNKLDPRAKAVLFPGEHGKALNSFANAMSAIKEGGKYTNKSVTGLSVNVAALLYGMLHAPLTAGGTVAGEIGLGKLLASSKFAQWIASAPKKPNAPALLAHIQRLNSVAAAQPAIANEVHILQERLASFFANPSTPLAAQDENQPRLEPEK